LTSSAPSLLRALASGPAQRERTRRLTALLQGAQYILGGDEHDILRIESDTTRVYKLTRGNIFGCRNYFSPVDPEFIGHFFGEGMKQDSDATSQQSP